MLKRKEFDYTMMSTFLTCRRKYFFRMVRNLVGKRPALAPEFGRCIHLALDEWYANKDPDKAIKAFKEAYTEYPEEDAKRTHAMGEWILKNYHEKYRDQPLEVLRTEHVFCLPLPNGNNFIGRIDKIIKGYEGIWVMDHKTTSRLGAAFFKDATPNMQFDGYTWAAVQEGYPCNGVVVDAVLVAKGLLPGKSKNPNLTPLARDFAYRNHSQLNAFPTHAMKIQEDVSRCEDSNDWYPNFDSCTDYGECPYRRICLEDEAIWKKVQDMDYQEEEWDPRPKEVAK